MRKLPRSLRFYVAASTLHAAVVFFAVQFIYTFQLTQSGLLVAQRDSGDVLSSIQIVAFIVWLGISLIAAAVMHRLATALAGAKTAEEEAKAAGEQKEQELGSIFGLSAAIAGPLDLEQIGSYFVAAIRGALPADMTLALIVYDDVLEAFRTLATDGPRGARSARQSGRAARPSEPRPRGDPARHRRGAREGAGGFPSARLHGRNRGRPRRLLRVGRDRRRAGRDRGKARSCRASRGAA